MIHMHPGYEELVDLVPVATAGSQSIVRVSEKMYINYYIKRLEYTMPDESITTVH
jgi:hypothetical protein